jgi:hypothetical protein
MKLREHPRVSYKGFPSWPPSWVWRSGNNYREATGDVRILKDVIQSRVDPCDHCFLIMRHEGQEYVGTLLFEDPIFCHEIYRLLIEHCGEPIQQIAEMDLTSHFPASRA